MRLSQIFSEPVEHIQFLFKKDLWLLSNIHWNKCVRILPNSNGNRFIIMIGAIIWFISKNLIITKVVSLKMHFHAVAIVLFCRMSHSVWQTPSDSLREYWEHQRNVVRFYCGRNYLTSFELKCRSRHEFLNLNEEFHSVWQTLH